jgi:hypothetical protein
LCSFQINFWVGTAVSAAPDQPPLTIIIIIFSLNKKDDAKGHENLLEVTFKEVFTSTTITVELLPVLEFFNCFFVYKIVF